MNIKSILIQSENFYSNVLEFLRTYPVSNYSTGIKKIQIPIRLQKQESAT